MKKTIVWIIAIFVLLLVAGTFYFSQGKIDTGAVFEYHPNNSPAIVQKPIKQTIDHYHYSCDTHATSSVTVWLSSGDSVTADRLSMGDLSSFLVLLSQKDLQYNTRLLVFTNF
jgi:hypothetical protein